MRTLALFLLLAPAVRAQEAPKAAWRASDKVYVGAAQYFADDLQVGVLLPSGRWDLSGRVKTLQQGDAFHGDQTEYSARLERHLPHVSVAGRLGTAPPDSQRLAYHLAAGEVRLTVYGLTLGPTDPDRIATVAEDTATAAALSSLDRTWVTRVRCVYTNADFHRSAHTAAEHDFRLVQNSWQFRVSETWKGVATLAVNGGGNRYSRTLHPFDPVWRHWNVDYESAPFPTQGYANQYLGADVERVLGDFRGRVAFTRINKLFGRIRSMTGTELFWRPRGGALEAEAGAYTVHDLGGPTLGAFSLALAGRW